MNYILPNIMDNPEKPEKKYMQFQKWYASSVSNEISTLDWTIRWAGYVWHPWLTALVALAGLWLSTNMLMFSRCEVYYVGLAQH